MQKSHRNTSVNSARRFQTAAKLNGLSEFELEGIKKLTCYKHQIKLRKKFTENSIIVDAFVCLLGNPTIIMKMLFVYGIQDLREFTIQSIALC